MCPYHIQPSVRIGRPCCVTMELRWFRAAFTASVLLTMLLVKNSLSECRFVYTHQPPSTTINDCNPYRSKQASLIRLLIRLECRVRRQAGVTDQFYIRWFRENTTGGVEDLGPGSDTSSSIELVSQYRGPAFTNQQYNPSFLGKYWCQVIINTTADPEQALMRSNVFTLLAPENYTGSTCAKSLLIQAVTNTTCADQPGQFAQTMLPVPAATTAPLPTVISMFSTQQSPTSISIQQTPSIISLQQSPSSVSTNSETPVSSTITYVVVATVLVVLVVSVTVITMVTVLVYKRCSRKQKTAQVATSTQSVEMRNVNVQNQSPREARYFNFQYFHQHPPSLPLPPDHNETQEHSINSADYQPLNTDTINYISMYSTITTARRMRAPSVEVEGQLYSILDPTRREEHVYFTPQ